MYIASATFATPLEAALSYAQRGWLIFPGRAGGRLGSYATMAVNGNPWGATSDPDLIRHYWQRWPRADVSVATGAGSGLFVLDVESVAGHGVDGLSTVQTLERSHGRLPRTAGVRSRNDGRHLYFKHPGAGSKVRVGNIADGIETKGDGGSITLPPTAGYTWLSSPDDIADPPAWLLKLVLSEQPRRNSNPDNLIEDMPADQIRAALEVIPNKDLHWDTWNKIGMAIFRATSGSEEGLAVFIMWSAKSAKFSEAAARERWKRFGRSPPTKIGRGTIEYLANQADPDWCDKKYLSTMDLTYRGRTQ